MSDPLIAMLLLNTVLFTMISKTVVSFLLAAIIPIVSTNKNELNDFLFNGDYEFIDLTHPFDNSTVYWPSAKKFEFTKKIEEYQQDGIWYAANDFAAGEHGGTHIDAPYHFVRKGKFVGDISIEQLIVPLIVVDISSRVNDDSNFVLNKMHLDYMLNYNFGKPCLLVFKFGWTKFYNSSKYLGIEEDGTLSFPGLSAEIATWIVTSYKNVVGIGVDVASIDPGSSKNYPVHQIVLEAGLYNLENVKLDRDIPDYGCAAIVLPMKIAKGTGAPLRLVAICPKQIPTNF